MLEQEQETAQAGIKVLPESVMRMGKEAKAMDASRNQLTKLPEEVSVLTNLVRLTLDRNKLASLPESVDGMAFLKHITANENSLKELPDAIGRLPRLETLSVAGNQLRGVPCLAGNQSLRQLHIGSNHLNELPSGEDLPSSLEEVSAERNSIREIPSSFSNLCNLLKLVLDDNKIANVPSEVFSGCTKLRTLSLHGCPISRQVLEDTDGYEQFRQRMKEFHGKQVASGIILGERALDEGFDTGARS